MPTKIDSCSRVHHGIAGPTPEHILASIRAEFSLPPSAAASEAVQQSKTGDAMTILSQARRFRDLANMIPHSAIALPARAAIAAIFWRAAQAKLANFDLTISLFQDEYLKNLPFLPAAPMAYLATAVELTMPSLILVGLLTRLATLPLIGMTLFIQTFVYPMSWTDHLVWIALLGFLLARGPGAISLDALLARQFGRNGSPMQAGA